MLPRVKEGILKFITPIAQVRQSERENNSGSPLDSQAKEPAPSPVEPSRKESKPSLNPELKPGMGLLSLSAAFFEFSKKVLQKGRAITRYGKRSEANKASDLDRGRVIDENID